jgi:predicted Holliday junction resolvase-like endonuclease
MTHRQQQLLVTIMSLMAFVAAIANVFGDHQVRNLQDEVNQRQKFIQDTVALETLNREIVQALAQLSNKNNDGDLRKLLAAQGISFSSSPVPVAEASPKLAR